MPIAALKCAVSTARHACAASGSSLRKVCASVPLPVWDRPGSWIIGYVPYFIMYLILKYLILGHSLVEATIVVGFVRIAPDRLFSLRPGLTVQFRLD